MEKITFKSQEEKDSIYAFAYLVAKRVIANDDENKEDVLGVYMQDIDYAKKYFENLIKERDSFKVERDSFKVERDSFKVERDSFKEKLAKALLINGESIKQVAKESELSIQQVRKLQMSLL